MSRANRCSAVPRVSLLSPRASNLLPIIEKAPSPLTFIRFAFPFVFPFVFVVDLDMNLKWNESNIGSAELKKSAAQIQFLESRLCSMRLFYPSGGIHR
ncbi:hypothetical protein FA15DRAFT_665393 [Coprinopsis marcescibilis]|uniref:Uncharacterized protein n=1 Tax=Coprinopsis marcescibilis TaxID=230819 RepID=A0A5C3L6P6_COPMA|nr:hypothetical protein FA15DRAFT_665393 [Coprinopsis marcescibilis]